MNEKVTIPEMSNEEIIKWYKTIKPIVRKNKIPYFLCELKDEDVPNTHFTWIDSTQKYGKKVDLSQMSIVAEMLMYHKYLDYMTFKPTIGEVISQIPKGIHENVDAFEIIDCLNEVKDGHHISLVYLYRYNS